ncbi:MAG: amino acid ABC transporter substrate-binding protein [Alphaproteobacteria bacterium]|nr:amino acid ABC transporter substrate-binding protein [Alphaproteobacteria bacterium]
MLNTLLSVLVSLFILGTGAGVTSAATLDDVKNRGWLRCGVPPEQPGFAARDQDDVWSGLHIDFCRAVAAAVFGDGSNARFSPLTLRAGYGALRSGDIDILLHDSTWTMAADAAHGTSFSVVTFYDGQGFLVHKDMAINSTLELSGASICLVSDETTRSNLADYFGSNKMEYVLVEFDKVSDAVGAYEAGQCNVYTDRSSRLEAHRRRLSDPEAHVILADSISKEPIGPVTRDSDGQWINIVRWTHFAMLDAEELGVSQANLEEMKIAENPPVKRLLGSEGAFGEAIGLSREWAFNIIREVGNYADTFDRNVGAETALGLTRGQNALWVDGGLHYGPPIR